jgi:hypothetical protein
MEGSRGRKHAAASASSSAAACGSVSQPPEIGSVVAGSRSVCIRAGDGAGHACAPRP